MKRKAELLLLLSSVVCCALALELFFYLGHKEGKTYPAVMYLTDDPSTRVLCYDDEFRSAADWDLRQQNHPYGELRYKMNMDKDPALDGLDPRNVPFAVELRLNEAGFRERDLTALALADSSEVTLVIGDSFGAGQGVRLQDRLTEVLEQALNDSLEQPQLLVNLCKRGYNIKMVSQTLTHHIGSFPRVRRVIYLYNLNDAALDAHGFELSQAIDDFMHLRVNLLAASVEGSILGHSYAASWVLQRLARRRIASRTIEWYNYMYTDNDGWRVTMKRLDQMVRLSADHGADFIIVLFPMFIDLKDYPLVSAHAAVGEYARRAQVDFVDLLELFEGRSERDYWVHPRDFHPNDRAHAEVARYLHKTLDWDGTNESANLMNRRRATRGHSP